MKESWRHVKDSNEMYAVSDRGRLVSRYSGKWKLMKVSRTDWGYLRTCLSLREGKKSVFIHRLVLETFVGPCPPGLETCHLDGNKLNNKLSNLEWNTKKKNYSDQKKHGVAAVGERSGSSRLTEGQVRQIRKEYAEGKETTTSMGARYGVSQVNIGVIGRRETWKHVH